MANERQDPPTDDQPQKSQAGFVPKKRKLFKLSVINVNRFVA